MFGFSKHVWYSLIMINWSCCREASDYAHNKCPREVKQLTNTLFIWKRSFFFCWNKRREETRRLVDPTLWRLGRKHFMGPHLSLCPSPLVASCYPQKLLSGLPPSSLFLLLFYNNSHSTKLSHKLFIDPISFNFQVLLRRHHNTLQIINSKYPSFRMQNLKT